MSHVRRFPLVKDRAQTKAPKKLAYTTQAPPATLLW